MTPPNNVQTDAKRRMPLTDPVQLQTAALVIISFAVVLFLLVQARFMMISLVTAIILFSLTTDAINLVARQRIGVFRVPNLVASVVALVAIAAALLTLTSVILAQVNTVLTTALSYTERAPEAIAALFVWLGPEVQQAVFESVATVDASGFAGTLASQAGDLMQATVLIILFVGFLFAERVWFSTKLVNLTGSKQQARRIEIIGGSIMRRVNRYLLVKTLVSFVTGVIVWFVAELFKLDLAVALGVITFILNFIPNVGSVIATGLVALVTHVQLGDPTSTAAVFLTVGVIQFVIGNFIDPMLLGRALRLSSFGIIISLAFWGAVWGIPGMFLSVPIMVALMIICSEIPAMRPLAILLSREGLPEPELVPRPVLRDAAE